MAVCVLGCQVHRLSGADGAFQCERHEPQIFLFIARANLAEPVLGPSCIFGPRAEHLASAHTAVVPLGKAVAREGEGELFLLVLRRRAMLAQKARVDLRHGGDVLRALHAPLDLEARDAHVHHLRHEGREVRVLQAQRMAVRPAGKAVGQTAGLGARAAVAAAPPDDGGHLTLAAVTHAQRAVDKSFDLNGAFLADFGDLPARKLAREHRARHAEPCRFLNARERVQAHLRRGVQRHVGNDFLQRRQNAPILHQDRVHAALRRGARLRGKRGELAVGDERVERQIDLHAPQMAIRNRRAEFFVREVPRAAARVERAKAHIHGVCAALHGGNKRLLPARGR